MTDIEQVFSYGDRPVRVESVNGEPAFVHVDVCAVLEIGNPSEALRRLDADEHTLISTEGPNGRRDLNVITEAGLYSLILGSRKPQAKPFKRWVTHEVLPQIRRTGSYSATPAIPDMSTPEGQLAVLDMVRVQVEARMVADRRAAEERAGRELAERQVAELEPSAHRWDTLVDTEGDNLIGDVAKFLQNDGIDTGPRRLFQQMEKLGWIYRTTQWSPWRAKQTAIATGRLRERPMTRERADTGERVAAPPQVRVTFKGLEALHKALKPGQLAILPGGAA